MVSHAEDVERALDQVLAVRSLPVRVEQRPIVSAAQAIQSPGAASAARPDP